MRLANRRLQPLGHLSGSFRIIAEFSVLESYIGSDNPGQNPTTGTSLLPFGAFSTTSA